MSMKSSPGRRTAAPRALRLGAAQARLPTRRAVLLTASAVLCYWFVSSGRTYSQAADGGVTASVVVRASRGTELLEEPGPEAQQHIGSAAQAAQLAAQAAERAAQAAAAAAQAAQEAQAAAAAAAAQAGSGAGCAAGRATAARGSPPPRNI